MDKLSDIFGRRAFVGGALLLGASTLISSKQAFATPTATEKLDEANVVRLQVIELEKQLGLATDSYFDALDAYTASVIAVEGAQGRINEANLKIGELQNQLGKRVRNMYKSDSGTFLDFLLGSSSFEEFATNLDFLHKLNQNDADIVREIKLQRTSIEEDKALLDAEMIKAHAKADEAAHIKAQAESDVVLLQSLLASLDEEARILLEYEQALSQEAMASEAIAQGGQVTSQRRYYYTYSGGTGEQFASYPEVADYALTKLGGKYVWGAEGPVDFDCSGLVTWCFRQIGMSIPHQTESQYHRAVWRGYPFQARRGDILWIGYGDGFNGHVGIALEDGGTAYVHAPTFDVPVCIDTSARFTHVLRF